MKSIAQLTPEDKLRIWRDKDPEWTCVIHRSSFDTCTHFRTEQDWINTMDMNNGWVRRDALDKPRQAG